MEVGERFVDNVVRNVRDRLDACLKVHGGQGEGKKDPFLGDLWKTNNCQRCQSQTSLVESPWPHEGAAVSVLLLDENLSIYSVVPCPTTVSCQAYI